MPTWSIARPCAGCSATKRSTRRCCSARSRSSKTWRRRSTVASTGPTPSPTSRSSMVSLLIVVIVTSIVFDFINGFHDAANAIATVVSTGVLPVRTAVLMAGLFNFIGAITGTAVAKTIASGFADPAIVVQTVVLAALLGAITWNLITWWYGIPSSSSHALVGGLAGAVVAHAGVGAFKWATLGEKVLIPLVISPLLGFVMAFAVMVGLTWGEITSGM